MSQGTFRDTDTLEARGGSSAAAYPSMSDPEESGIRPPSGRFRVDSSAPTESRLLLVSAADQDALSQRIQDLREHLTTHDQALKDVAYTLVHGRRAFTHAAALVAPEPTPLSDAPADAWLTTRAKRPSTPPKVAFMFPGQGAQFVGMGRQLYAQQPRFRALVEHCDTVLSPLLEVSIKDLLVPDEGADNEALTETLKQTAIAQPALFVVEYGLADLLVHYGVEPDLLLGHSIGEYAAACLAGVFELEAALRLVAERGRLMQSMPPGTMIAVQAEPDELTDFCRDGVDLAAHNSPGLSVLAGPSEAIEAASKQLAEHGLQAQALRTSHAFHSAMMEPILEPFARAVEAAGPRPPERPIVSTMTGGLLTAEQATSSEYWAQQLRNPVRFADAANVACDGAERVLVEVGPGVALSTSVGKVAAQATRPRKVLETLGHPKHAVPAMDAVLRCVGQLWLQGATPAWDTLFPPDRCKLVRLPTYPYRRSRHWIEPPAPAATVAQVAAAPVVAAAPTPEPLGNVAPQDLVLEKVVQLLGERLGAELEGDDHDRSFLELGFDSLALSQLVAKLKQGFGIRVRVRRLFEDLNTPRTLAGHVAAEGHVVPDAPASPVATGSSAGVSPEAVPPSPHAASHQAFDAVMDRLSHIERKLDQLSLDEAEAPSARRVSASSTMRELTGSQREIWVAVEIGGEPANLAYNECRSFRFDGPLDETAIEASLDELSLRHEALRQTFTKDGAYCVTHKRMPLALTKADLRTEDTDTRQQRLRTLHDEAVQTPFDLSEGPLWRGTLVRIAPQESCLILCAHHIVVDGSSWEILVRELAALYTARVENKPAELPPAASFASYGAAQLEYESSLEARENERFWLQHLHGQTEDLALPTDGPRPPQRTFRSTRLDHRLSPEVARRVREAASDAKCTPQTYLLAAFQVLLHGLTRQTDLVIGIPTSGQAADGLDSLVGHCVHELPLRTLFAPEESIASHLQALHSRLLDGLDHQRVTFSEVMHELQRPRDPSRAGLIQVAFGMGRLVRRPYFSGTQTEVRVVPRVSESHELYVYAVSDDDGLEVSWSYNTDLFAGETIAAWQRCFETIIRGLLESSPDRPLSAIPIVHEVDRHRLLELARGPAVERDNVPIHRTIAARAASQGSAVAVRDVAGEHTYSELDARANRIAHYLLSLGARQSPLVAVCLERSFELMASLLGVWRAGLGYIPLDPAYPAQRIEVILEDSGFPVLLTSSELLDRIPAGCNAVCLEDAASAIAAQAPTAPEVTSAPEDTAYVIFTSGSTGRPKGVQVPHRAVEDFIATAARTPGFDEHDRMLAISTVSFDMSAPELYLPLFCGGSLTLATRDQALSPRELQRLLRDHDITVMVATPATWQMLFDGGWEGHPGLKVLCGGEAFPPHLAERFLATCGDIWNIYGPTETTVFSALKHVHDASDITIGRPVENTTICVLDEQRRLVPPGAHGELWIGGRGVADGYLGRPELTAERFVESPFEAGDRLYRTGDLGRLRPDGDLECLGRVDFQVKVRGFRIELGEIESAAVAHPDVSACVVVARSNDDDDNNNKFLVAYFVPEEGANLDGDSLRRFISDRLPPYMVPNAYCVLQSLPMSPNNKVDRKALPAPAPDTIEAEQSQPKDRLEADVLAVFREYLNYPELGPQHNFFMVGGHSLLAIRIVDAIEEKVGIAAPVNVLLGKPTVADFTEWLQQEGAHDSEEPPPRDRRPATARSRRLTRAACKHQGLFQIQKGDGAGVPLFLIHGDRANAELLPELSPDQEVWGYHHQGADGERIMLESVEALAQHCLDEWVQQHNDRPCILAGYSFGALVAYHVAVLRQQAGLETPRLILLDARHPDVLFGANALRRPNGTLTWLRSLRWLAFSKADHKRALQYLDRGERVPEKMRSPYIRATYTLATRQYHPPPYEGDLDLIRSEESVRRTPMDGWQDVASGRVRATTLSGSHLDLVRTSKGIRQIGQQIHLICSQVNARR